MTLSLILFICYQLAIVPISYALFKNTSQKDSFWKRLDSQKKYENLLMAHCFFSILLYLFVLLENNFKGLNVYIAGLLLSLIYYLAVGFVINKLYNKMNEKKEKERESFYLSLGIKAKVESSDYKKFTEHFSNDKINYYFHRFSGLSIHTKASAPDYIKTSIEFKCEEIKVSYDFEPKDGSSTFLSSESISYQDYKEKKNPFIQSKIEEFNLNYTLFLENYQNVDNKKEQELSEIKKLETELKKAEIIKKAKEMVQSESFTHEMAKKQIKENIDSCMIISKASSIDPSLSTELKEKLYQKEITKF